MKILLIIAILSTLSSLTLGFVQNSSSIIAPTPIQDENSEKTPATRVSDNQIIEYNISTDKGYMIIPVQSGAPHSHTVQSNSLISIALGLIILIFALPVVWLSERRTAELSQIFHEGMKACLDGNPAEYRPELNEDLVCISGTIANSSSLDDPTFRVSVDNAVKIKRIVEVYQVKESKVNKKVSKKAAKDDASGYNYENIWCPYSLPSTIFRNEKYQTANNNVKFIAHSQTIVADNIEFGQHKLAPFQIERLSNWELEPVEAVKAQIENAEDHIRRQLEIAGWKNCVIKVDGDYVLIKQHEGDAVEIGDMRISYQKVPCGVVTVIGEQAGILFRPYNVKLRMFLRESESEMARLLDDEDMGLCPRLEGKVDLCCSSACCLSLILDKHMAAPRVINWIYPGKLSKEEIFRREVKQNRLLGTFMRILGASLILLGVYLVMSPLIRTLVVTRTIDHYHINGGIVVGLLMGVIVELIAVGFAWMFYRRWLALGLLVLSALIVSTICLLENWSFLLISKTQNVQIAPVMRF